MLWHSLMWWEPLLLQHSSTLTSRIKCVSMLKFEAIKCFETLSWQYLLFLSFLILSNWPLSAWLQFWTHGSFSTQALLFYEAANVKFFLGGEGSSDPVEDLGLCPVSQAKCLLWLKQWSIVCFWMRSLCLNLALDCRSAQSLLQQHAHTPKYEWTALTEHPESVLHCMRYKTVMSQHEFVSHVVNWVDLNELVLNLAHHFTIYNRFYI